MEKRRFFMKTRVAGMTYYDGICCFDELKVGTELRLVAEPDNKYDPNAIEVYYGEDKLGYIPRSVNEQIAVLFAMGWTELFEVRINQVLPEAHPEEQIQITIFVRNFKTVFVDPAEEEDEEKPFEAL